MLAPVIAETWRKPGADSRLQAQSPAHDIQSDVRGKNEDKSIEDERRGSGDGRREEQYIKGTGNSGEQGTGIDRGSKNKKTREQRRHSRGNGRKKIDGQSDQADSLWLKSLMPEASSGWWDVYQKDNGFAVKFRWRDQGRKTLTFPQISYQQLQALRQSAPDETRKIMRERISASLRRFLIDPDKRDKALLVAQKLGIDPDELRNFTTTN
jgi:hypothetical protein